MRALLVILGLLLGPSALASGSASTGPKCRFPGSWTRMADPVRVEGGTHIGEAMQIAADPSVLFHDGKYRAWFTKGEIHGGAYRGGIGYAESSDGSTWKARPGLVLSGRPGEWDEVLIETANVLRTPEGRYRMYYTGSRAPAGSRVHAIGVAESDDGIAWTRRGDPVLEPVHAWELPLNHRDPAKHAIGGVLEPSVVYDPAARLYRMWYVGLGEKPGKLRTFRVGLATSPDGFTWTRHPEPVFEPEAANAWDGLWTSHVHVVPDPRAGYHLFYFGTSPAEYKEGAPMQRGALGHAYSPDGIKWERDPANPILKPRPGKVDAWATGGPSAIIENGKFRMWYFGLPKGDAYTSNLVLAEAACG